MSKKTMAFTPWAASITLRSLLYKKLSGQGWQSMKTPLPHLSIAEDVFQGWGSPPLAPNSVCEELYWAGDRSCWVVPIPAPQTAEQGDSGQA